jgi:rRNA processing protein Krr1/Pno1
MNSLFLKVPKQRIGAVIGKQGETRRELEEMCDCKIHVDRRHRNNKPKCKCSYFL